MIISEKELERYGMVENLSQQAFSLLLQQKDNWDLVNKNFLALNDIETRKFHFNNIYIETQFNPSRIISSSAKVDESSIKKRACFLCKESLPKVQKGINYHDKYMILVNPYPIFKQHLTIPKFKHLPQSIDTNLLDMLNLAFDLREDYFVFYNGPKCGASAPDHMHFQAALKSSTPLENFYDKLIDSGMGIFETANLKMKFVKGDIIKFFSMQSKDKHEIESRFLTLYKKLQQKLSITDEPLLNIICIYENDQWNLFVIPRKSHRPEQFFRDGADKLIISPASVDMSGLLITPREEDFYKLKKEDITDIYNQVLFDDEFFKEFVESDNH